MPIAIKNNRPVKGLRLTYGCSLMADYVADYDHNVTRRLRDAGFVIVGTTTLPEYGILPDSARRASSARRATPGTCERTPGGSSGGAAAAVAAGMVPVAHGNDGGGSIRIPAACCGLVGLKPARGRISAAPELGDSSLGIDGMLTRTVADTAAILDVLAGYEPGDATWAPPPAEPFAAAAAARSRPAADRRDHAAADPGRRRRPDLRAGRRATPPSCCARSATRSGGRPAVAERRRSRSCSAPSSPRTSRSAAVSATVRVSMPSPAATSPSSGAAEIRPRVGFSPTSPQQAAGMRIEPAVVAVGDGHHPGRHGRGERLRMSRRACAAGPGVRVSSEDAGLAHGTGRTQGEVDRANPRPRAAR